MKKANIIQLALIVIGIIMGFLSVQSLFSFLSGFVLSFFSDENYGNMLLLGNVYILIMSLLQVALCWIMITKSESFAKALATRANIEGSFSITTTTSDLLFIILIAIGIYLVLTNLTSLITNIFFGFKSKAGGIFQTDESPSLANWIRSFSNLLLPLILLMFARPISNYFSKNINEEDVLVEDTIGEISSHEESQN